MNSNALAHHNGREIETTICQLLNIERLDEHHYDAILDGHPLEIKSCQEHITDIHNANGWRSGRFKLNEEQDKYLKENNGIYAFVVHVDGEIKRTCFRKASLIGGIVGRACGKVWSGVMSG